MPGTGDVPSVDIPGWCKCLCSTLSISSIFQILSDIHLAKESPAKVIKFDLQISDAFFDCLPSDFNSIVRDVFELACPEPRSLPSRRRPAVCSPLLSFVTCSAYPLSALESTNLFVPGPHLLVVTRHNMLMCCPRRCQGCFSDL